MNRVAWSDEHEAEFIALHRAGAAVAEIAARFGRTRKALAQKMRQFRLAGRLPRYEQPGAVVPNLNEDQKHVAACLKGGSFLAYTETRPTPARRRFTLSLPLVRARDL